MSRIGDSLDRRINVSNKQWVSNTTGIIVDYDKKLGTCSVKYHNPKGDGYYFKEHARIENNSGGFSMDNISAGQYCNITFANGDVSNPIVTGLFGSDYNGRRSEDGGNFLIDSDIYDVKIPDEIEPLKDDWFDYDNENPEKYKLDDLGDDTQVDSQQAVIEMLNQIANFSDNESGFTNLNSKATIKMRSNGDINIFTGINTGIRICADGSIRIYGKQIYFNDKEIKEYLKDE